MRKHLIALAAAAVLAQTNIGAQSVDSLYIDARGSFLPTLQQGDYRSRMAQEYFNVQMWGHLTDNVTFRIRQRMNVAVDQNNPFRATDWLCLSWQASEKLRLYGGKTAILVGGYEYDAAPIDVYFYSQFCSNLSQYFAFSANAEYAVSKGQKAVFQVSNSPLYNGFSDCYAYNLGWIGGFGPRWETIWTVNMIEDTSKRIINYIALGNHLTFGNVFFDLDLYHRASFQQKQFFFSDYSLVSKLIWRVGNWNICGKVGYETNAADNVDALGSAYDVVVVPGKEHLYGGCGLEYFPLGNEKIRLHLAYFRSNYDHTDNLSIGMKWRIDIVK